MFLGGSIRSSASRHCGGGQFLDTMAVTEPVAA
jgi:hypothetical protein